MDPDARQGPAAATATEEPSADVLLSVVVPVYNQAGSIVENLHAIHERVAGRIDGALELIVVSDGSIDETEERLLETELPGLRVLHYDRNLGKGYAIKVGALETRGRFVGYVDADLDLDPGSLPDFVRIAERDGLDFAIGSKRHPDSQVHYPASRRVASWLFQQLVRALFQLDVRDTQVGLKVFRREVADQVLPLLLVKRYAFDIELLAVARAFGFGRVRELPIKLDYQFSGSGVRPVNVVIALVDTLAVFYRLRILRTYQRKRALVGAFGWTRPSGYRPHVTAIAAEDLPAGRLDWPELDVVVVAGGWAQRRAAALRARGELVAFVEPGAVPSANFVSATVPFLARPQVAAVVTSKLAPAGGSLRARAAAAVRESRLGGGSLYFRYIPGNIRYVREFPTASFVVRRDRLAELPETIAAEGVPGALAECGELVIYTPEASLVGSPEELFGPHLAHTAAYGRERGCAVRRRGVSALRPSTAAGLVLGAFLAAGWLPALLVRDGLWVWSGVLGSYAAAILASALLASLQFRSLAVGALAAAGLVSTHLVYARAFVAGLLRP